ncbi:hypothetical protein K435DRAFT_881427 [Dendrothele bispora CBS 962.96]|uniref:Uncharacterized protein n=1 Tax=Dendrothele bispora (strain CBS 962.96) TaxID=1314807 RepID=A0A4S8KIN4_DENBC|nr:hypothetical protein K435DRAFT_881427 [Dendrothele bispora CBS 962.96]
MKFFHDDVMALQSFAHYNWQNVNVEPCICACPVVLLQIVVSKFSKWYMASSYYYPSTQSRPASHSVSSATLNLPSLR